MYVKNIFVHIFAIKKVLIMLDFLKLFALSLSFFRTTRTNQAVLCTKLPTTCEFDTCPCGSFKCVCVCGGVHVAFNDFTRRGQLVFTIDIVAGNTLFVMGNPNSM